MDTAHRCLNKQAKERKPVEDTRLRKRRTFLVAQWIGTRLPMQGTQVLSLVREGPTCCRAAKPLHNF